jgi:hypothetical protein
MTPSPVRHVRVAGRSDRPREGTPAQRGRPDMPGRRRCVPARHPCTSPERVSADAALPRAAVGFRPDIQGLRGVAVLIVALDHAGVPGMGGGYVGVDVFFVISGFLITGWLLGRALDANHVPFGDFYAARARRILPAARADARGHLCRQRGVVEPSAGAIGPPRRALGCCLRRERALRPRRRRLLRA